MNYHFNGNSRKEQLLSQLNQLDKDLQKDKNSFERLKLEEQFYQDKDKAPSKVSKQSLADQIMKQLISEPKKPQYEPPKMNYQQPAKYQSPNREVVRQPKKQQPVQPQRQNYFINEREQQKNKLQNQKHEGLFPNSSDHNKVRSLGKQNHIPEQDRVISPKKDNVQNMPSSPRKNDRNDDRARFDPSYNPFVPDDVVQKQRKEEKNRQYLKALEEQRLEHERQRKEREREEKEIKIANFDNYLPQPKVDVQQKPLVMKKIDPNSKPPKIERAMGNYSQFDKTLIKNKVIELKTKFKKGKIIYEQYERELNNFKKQYPGDIEELLEEDNPPRKQISPSYQKVDSPKKIPEVQLPSMQSLDDPNREALKFPIKNESINYSQFMPSQLNQQQTSQAPPLNYMPTNSHNYHSSQNNNVNSMNMYPPNLLNMVPPSYFQGTPPAQYMELLKKMFDFMFKEVRDVRNQQMNQNHVLQDTLNKFLVMNSQQNLLTQNIAPIPPNYLQKEFYSDAKQHRQYFDKQSNVKKKPMPSNESISIPFGQSDASEYYDKSLSAIASKIPLNQRVKTKEDDPRQERFKQSMLDQFYNKVYKIKPLKKFNILIDATQSQAEIPSTSSYLRAKNAKEQLKVRAEEDLAELKRLQSDKNFKKFAGKMQGNSTYGDKRRLVQPETRAVGSKPYQKYPSSKQDNFEGNPYLKKHISQDQNILTFNEKGMKVSSPSGYSPVAKKEILEQDEYQTEPKVRQQYKGSSSLIQDYEQKITHPSQALNFIKMNNQVLSKYEKSEESKKDFLSIKETSRLDPGSDYFGHNQISPVKSPQHYEQSLQTIRSELVSVKLSQRPNKLFNMNSPNDLAPIPADSMEVRNQNASGHEMRYSETVQSVEESSSKLRKPPNPKRRSISKKKESSLSRSKLQHDYESRNSLDGSASFEPNYPKFDSNIYDSNYEESIEVAKFRNAPANIIANKPFGGQTKEKQLQFNPPEILTPKGEDCHIEKNAQEPRPTSSRLSQPQNKWKSLEEARKLAKQCRVKVDDSSNYKSVQQKFSELESFMTKKGDESLQFRQTPSQLVRQKAIKKESPKKKNILKLLEDLEQNDDENMYKQEFQSYREESENYQ